MAIKFEKYQGTGNDFILVDDWDKQFPVNNEEWIRSLCTRKFGIGADGLILLQTDENADFRMMYFNADGKQGSMCGNGGRCIAHFAWQKGFAGRNMRFAAVDGLHQAIVNDDETIRLSMQPVAGMKEYGGAFLLDTGSPHYVSFVEDNGSVDVVNEGRRVRNSEQFEKNGINVNFVETSGENAIVVRTYERGVEDETLSCGTGVVASALAYTGRKGMSRHKRFEVNVATKGGELKVYFKKVDGSVADVWLEGPAIQVFRGWVG